jgi:hypothetical protein
MKKISLLDLCLGAYAAVYLAVISITLFHKTSSMCYKVVNHYKPIYISLPHRFHVDNFEGDEKTRQEKIALYKKEAREEQTNERSSEALQFFLIDYFVNVIISLLFGLPHLYLLLYLRRKARKESGE